MSPALVAQEGGKPSSKTKGSKKADNDSSSGKQHKKKAAAADEDSPDLRAEVRAFASQLGLSAAGAGGEAFGYDDFAPEKAKKRPSAAAAAAAAAAGDDGGAAAAANGKQRKERGGGDKQQQQRDSKHGGKQRDDDHRGKQRRADGANGAADADAADALAERRAREKQAAHDAAVAGRQWADSVGPRPGEAAGRPLLGRGAPPIWFEAAAELPPLPPPPAGAAISADDAEALRQAGERLIEREAAAFEKDLGRRNAADAKWLAQVKRGGTTADKVAAMTLLVQVRR